MAQPSGLLGVDHRASLVCRESCESPASSTHLAPDPFPYTYTCTAPIYSHGDMRSLPALRPPSSFDWQCMPFPCVTGYSESTSAAELQDLTPLDIEDEKQRADAEFYEYITQSYRYFLAGDDDECERIDSTKATEFEERAAEAENCNKQLQEASLCSRGL